MVKKEPTFAKTGIDQRVGFLCGLIATKLVKKDGISPNQKHLKIQGKRQEMIFRKFDDLFTIC